MDNQKDIKEIKWENDLEKRINERIKKRELCFLLDIPWSDSYDKYRYEFLCQRLSSNLKIVKKIGLGWKPSYIYYDTKKLEFFIKTLREKNEKMKGKITLKELSITRKIPLFHLNILRLRGYISCEQIGRCFYFEEEKIDGELSSLKVSEYLRRRGY